MTDNISITRTVPHSVTTLLANVASSGRHPSFPGGMPAMIAEPVEHGYCTDCASLAGQIRACERLGDADGMVDYGRAAIRHWFAIHEPDAVTTLQTRHTGGAR